MSLPPLSPPPSESVSGNQKGAGSVDSTTSNEYGAWLGSPRITHMNLQSVNNGAFAGPC